MFDEIQLHKNRQLHCNTQENANEKLHKAIGDYTTPDCRHPKCILIARKPGMGKTFLGGLFAEHPPVKTITQQVHYT